MRKWHDILFVISLFIPLFMGSLSYLSYQRHKEKELRHLTEFWVSQILAVLIMMSASGDANTTAALGMLGWLWPLRTFKLLMEDFSGSKVINQWHFIALGASAFVTFALAGNGVTFMYSTLPFSLAVGGIGLFVTYESFKKTRHDYCSALHKASYILFGLYFLRR